LTGTDQNFAGKMTWAGSILQIFSNLKISTKLVGGFGLVLFLIVCVIGIYHATVKSTTKAFKDLMHVNVVLADQAAEIKTLMKQCRIDEKNFLSTLEKKYLEQLETNIQSLKEKTQDIVTMSNRAQSGTTEEIASKVAVHVERYAKSFRNLVIAYEQRGLDVDTGLRGAFAAAAKRFVSEMTLLDVEDIYVHMLKIVKLQNEFIRTKDLKFQTKLKKTIAEYDQVVNKSDADKVTIKGAIRDILPDYRKSLKKMEIADTWELKKNYLEEMREIIEEINEFLSITYLPNSKAFILKVRSSEKDYLLFGGETYIKKVHENISILSTELANSNVGKDYLKNAKRYIKKYKKAFDNLAAQDKRIKTLYLLMSKQVSAIEGSVEGLYKDAKTLSSVKTRKVNTLAGNRSRLALTIGLVSILLGFTLAFFITRQINLPIIQAVLFSKNMSKGDFTSRLDIHQKDEIGILANALNGIVTDLGGMFRDISNDVNALSSSSENLRTISVQLSKGAEDTSSKSNTVASATEEMDANLSSVAATMEETSVNLSSVAAAT
jgi:methyl-accepting chemotaxis protein